MTNAILRLIQGVVVRETDVINQSEEEIRGYADSIVCWKKHMIKSEVFEKGT